MKQNYKTKRKARFALDVEFLPTMLRPFNWPELVMTPQVLDELISSVSMFSSEVTCALEPSKILFECNGSKSHVFVRLYQKEGDALVDSYLGEFSAEVELGKEGLRVIIGKEDEYIKTCLVTLDMLLDKREALTEFEARVERIHENNQLKIPS
jgi:hypothetical protein